MRNKLNLLVALAALAAGGVSVAQAQSSGSCCTGGKCGTCCVNCTQCGANCTPATCCKK